MRRNKNMKNKKSQKNYAYIDAQNVYKTIKRLGWVIDWKRFFIYLKDKYQVAKTYFFIGYLPENRAFYQFLQETGYIIIFKPVVIGEKQETIKGNCDAELVLQAVNDKKKYDQALIISGDGDFHCLVEYLEKRNKLFKLGIPGRKSYSSLLRRFQKYFFFIEDQKKKLKKERYPRKGQDPNRNLPYRN